MRKWCAPQVVVVVAQMAVLTCGLPVASAAGAVASVLSKRKWVHLPGNKVIHSRSGRAFSGKAVAPSQCHTVACLENGVAVGSVVWLPIDGLP